jgi:hypothetical protein
MTDAVLMKTGMEVLVDHLGDIETEKFISLLLREPFDYTEWRRDNLFTGMSVEEISHESMRLYNMTYPGPHS